MRAVNFPTPGVYGINTQDEIAVDSEQARFGTTVKNGLIDTSGKLVSRKNASLVTSGATVTIKSLYVHKQRNGTEVMFSAGSNAVYTGTTALTSRHTGATGNPHWQFASLSGKILMAQAGETFRVLTEATYASNAVTPSGAGGPGSNAVNCVIAAYGRAWAADAAAVSNSYTVWWSNLLDGTAWTGGDAGNLSLINAWPSGNDSIVALAAGFNRLFILGRKSILMYTLPADNDPASMTLTDTISSMGCVARDSVQVTDDGIYFLSDNGVYRINRLGQITALMVLPLISRLLNDEIVAATAANAAAAIKSGYDPVEGIYFLSFPTSNKTYVFHTRRILPDYDVPAIVEWNTTNAAFHAFASMGGDLYVGGALGIRKFTGYTPASSNHFYTFSYYTQWHAFGDESREKHGKTAMLTLKAAPGVAGTLNWQEDLVAGTTYSVDFTTGSAEFAEDTGLGSVEVELGGSYNVARWGFEFDFNTTTSNAISVHALRVFAQPGSIHPR